MFLTEAGCMLFFLYISGVQGQTNSICALKGSSVNLSCSAGDSAADKEYKWFTVFRNGSGSNFHEVVVDGNQKKYRISEESRPTLTINNLNKSDESIYACCEPADKQNSCSKNQTQLYIEELQVKVFPSKDGQTVTLMCSSGRPFTQKHTGFIWFKNRQFLYQDWSPWYQELVSSEEAVTYSCAVKGYEDLRAPEVSVDLVTTTCFRVTYAESSMCSSVNKQCSIVFPTEINVEQTRLQHDHVKLTCNSRCVTEPQTSIVLFRKKKEERTPITVPETSADTFTCAVKDLKDLHSADVCFDNSSCWTVNCVQKRICALKGSSLNIYCNYSHPRDQQPKSKLWFKVNRNIKQEKGLKQYYNNVTFNENPNQHNIRFKKLNESDSGEYVFRIQTNSGEWKESTFPEVTLIVTDLRVKIRPSAEVTEGQKVILTCSTSCPLTQNSNYYWYLNHQLLQRENKHLVIDEVTSQDAGNYSCVDKTKENVMSPVKTLIVKGTSPKIFTAPNNTEIWKPFVGVSSIVFVLVCFAVFLWIRSKRTSAQSSRSEVPNTLEKLNLDHMYEEIQAEEADCKLHNSHVNFENTLVYSTIQPHEEQEHAPYAITKFRRNSEREMVNDDV